MPSIRPSNWIANPSPLTTHPCSNYFRKIRLKRELSFLSSATCTGLTGVMAGVGTGGEAIGVEEVCG